MRNQRMGCLLMLACASVACAQSPSRQIKTVRVAAISFRPEKFNVSANADRLERAFRKARKGDAQLAVAPEGALEGYVVNEIIAGKVDAGKMKDVAVTIDSPTIRRFRKLARELEMCLVFGFAERVGNDVFNSAVFIDGAGNDSR